jgi:hypothetical protein
VDVSLVDLGVAEELLDGVEGASEKVLAQFLETSTSEGGVEIDPLKESVDFNRCGGGEEESSLGTFAGGTETTESARAGGEVLPVLALELLNGAVDEPVVEVLPTQVGVSGSSLDLEDTLFDGQERNDSSSTQIEIKDVAFTGGFLVKTVGDGSSGGFVDDPRDAKAADIACVFGGLTLRVIGICGDGNDGVGDGSRKVRLCGFPHFGQYHGRDLLGGLNTALVRDRDRLSKDQTYELLVLATVLCPDVRLAALVDDR